MVARGRGESQGQVVEPPCDPRFKRGFPQQPQVDDSIDRGIRVRGGQAGIPFGRETT